MLWVSANDLDREWIQQVVALLVGHGAFTLYPALSQCDNAAERLTRWLSYQLPRVKQAHLGCPIHQWLNSIGAQVIVEKWQSPEQWPNLHWLPLPEVDGHPQGGLVLLPAHFYRYMCMAQFKPEHCKQTRPPTPASFGALRLYLKQGNALPCTPNSKTAPFACPVRQSKWANHARGYY